jgi:hypothetical protein
MDLQKNAATILKNSDHQGPFITGFSSCGNFPETWGKKLPNDYFCKTTLCNFLREKLMLRECQEAIE